MPSKKRVIHLWRSIWKEIDPHSDPPVRLAFNGQWKEITGHNLGSALGRATREDMLVGIRYRGLEVEGIKETLWHEIGHILFPSKPHWWIECYGEKISRHGNGEGRYSTRFGHSPCELPSRNQLLIMSKEAMSRKDFKELAMKAQEKYGQLED